MAFLSGFEHFVRENEPLSGHTWLSLGGAAQYFAEPTSVEELAMLVKRCHEEEVPLRLLGAGSNLLVREAGVQGMVIRLDAPAFSAVDVHPDGVRAGGGALLGHLLSISVREGLAGLEHLAGIPGTVGGALHTNAGGSGGDIGQWTSKATVLTAKGELLSRTRDEMRFAYRQSSLDELVIVEAEFQLEKEDPEVLTRRLQKVWIVKRASQPAGGERVASLFKNAQGMSASDLIDQAKLRGTSVGGAAISDRNANFVVLGADATSDDVLQLIDLVKSRVEDLLEIELETGIEVW